MIDPSTAAIARPLAEPEQIVGIVQKENGIRIRDDGSWIIAEESGPKYLHRIRRLAESQFGIRGSGLSSSAIPHLLVSSPEACGKDNNCSCGDRCTAGEKPTETAAFFRRLLTFTLNTMSRQRMHDGESCVQWGWSTVVEICNGYCGAFKTREIVSLGNLN